LPKIINLLTQLTSREWQIKFTQQMGQEMLK